MTVPTPPSVAAVTLGQFNRLDPLVAADLIRPCLHAERWVAALIGARPYRLEDLIRVAPDAAQPLTADELTTAVLDRISRTPWPPPTIPNHAGTAGIQGVVARQILSDADRYTGWFGHPFLVREIRRSPHEIHTRLQIRLHNTREAEQRAVAHELRQIAVLASPGPSAPETGWHDTRPPTSRPG